MGRKQKAPKKLSLDETGSVFEYLWNPGDKVSTPRKEDNADQGSTLLGRLWAAADALTDDAAAPPLRKPTKSSKKKKSVDTSTTNTNTTSNDEPLELQVAPGTNPQGQEIPGSALIVYYVHTSTNTSSRRREDSAEVHLKQWQLGPAVQLRTLTARNCQGQQMGEMLPAQLPIRVLTFQGALELLHLCCATTKLKRGETAMASTGDSCQHLAHAVEKRLFLLIIHQKKESTPTYTVSLSLTDFAFDTCHPAKLSVRETSHTKAFQLAHCLNQSLMALFPKQTELLPLSQKSRDNTSSAPFINAKDVYALVDNVKLKHIMNRKKPPPGSPQEEPLTVPGLKPKLRPYQEAAVQWMLQREKGESGSNTAAAAAANQNNGREWELAWVIVTTSCTTTSTCTTSTTAVNNHTYPMARLYSLPEYMQQFPLRQRQTEDPSKHFLFCPFTGWLADSVKDAMDMTLPVRSLPIPDKPYTEAKGGILAESMGLGKTVEVLAVILANPHPSYPRNNNTVVVSSSSSSLAPSEESSSQVTDSQETGDSTQSKHGNNQNNPPLGEPLGTQKRRRIIKDSTKQSTHSLDSADDISDDDDTCSDDSLPIAQLKNKNQSAKEATSILSREQSRCSNNDDDTDTEIVVETPTSLEERWICTGNGEIGSCICGRSISFVPEMPPEDSVVVCQGCREPMHWTCAAFGKERKQLATMNRGVLFRHKLSKDGFWCRLCPETFCPCCVGSADSGTNDKLQSRATVIVAPAAILSQWEREIKMHVRDPIKVVVYSGVKILMNEQQQRRKKGGHEAFQFVHPRLLADNDLILTSFETLQQDLGHSDKNPFASGRASLRKRKRYRVVPSPLSTISWWRVCLDEAQRVETPTAGSAQMALKLDTGHRWAVSGTPVGRGKLEDLFGLLVFLRSTPPFNDWNWFRICFPSSGGAGWKSRLRLLLGSVFWRSTKSNELVAEQMAVPPQIEKKNLLKFSSIERHFYMTQLDKTLQIAGDLQSKTKPKDGAPFTKRPRGTKSLELLATEMHNLRAACCHPQVGSSGLALGKRSRTHGSVKVLTMTQVLDRLIYGAKNQCEEALRVSIFHSNAIAGIARLKVDAKRYHHISIAEHDDFLWAESCKLYQDALDLVDKNASPSLATGEALLTGSRGFRSNQKQSHGGKAVLDWQIQQHETARANQRSGEVKHLFANFEFDEPRKMRQIRVRSKAELTDESSWTLRYPKSCALQVSSKTGDEFMDILLFEIPEPDPACDPNSHWIVHGGAWVQRSKNWRLVVRSFHPLTVASNDDAGSPMDEYIALEFELYEPNVASDSLQRLHTLHNAIISFRGWLAAPCQTEKSRLPISLSATEANEKLGAMQSQIVEIERHQLDYIRGLRETCLSRFKALTDSRRRLENELVKLWMVLSKEKPAGFWDVCWWDFVISTAKFCSAEQQLSLLEKVNEAVEASKLYYSGDRQDALPEFRSIDELLLFTKTRFETILEGMQKGMYDKFIQKTTDLSPNPTREEVLENKYCQVCKAEWYQTGEKCRHCVLEENLMKIQCEEEKIVRNILTAIFKWLRTQTSTNRKATNASSPLKDAAAVAAKFFEAHEVSMKEILAAKRSWRVHLDFLNIIDELEACKTSMRLMNEGEDIREMSEEQQGLLVVPVDIQAKYYEHDTKKAMAEGNLRRQKDALSFLKRQSIEQEEHASDDDQCPVCYNSYTSDRAVLACGHSFCRSCADHLKKPSGLIKCLYRCTITTRYEDILTASNQRGDDGSRALRRVKGSWGTKVTAIVADLLSFRDKDEKSIVFSMWEDMLDIVQEALTANEVKYVRASSLRQLGKSTQKFQSSDVLLLNVKNGAEGLNLIEATHVLMIEPLLNSGLDSQAAARNHRIGQTRQTFLHRYIVEDTVEVGIDKHREQHQRQDEIEDAISGCRKASINAGGIDGGFSSKEELMSILGKIGS